jgi:hypothetical protein
VISILQYHCAQASAGALGDRGREVICTNRRTQIHKLLVIDAGDPPLRSKGQSSIPRQALEPNRPTPSSPCTVCGWRPESGNLAVYDGHSGQDGFTPGKKWMRRRGDTHPMIHIPSSKSRDDRSTFLIFVMLACDNMAELCCPNPFLVRFAFSVECMAPATMVSRLPSRKRSELWGTPSFRKSLTRMPRGYATIASSPSVMSHVRRGLHPALPSAFSGPVTVLLQEKIESSVGDAGTASNL